MNKNKQTVDYYPLKIAAIQEEGKVKMVAFAIEIEKGLEERILYKPIWAEGKYEDAVGVFGDLVDLIRNKIEK